MKIRPVILCGGAGTRLWPNQKNYQAKQFIDFGGWNLFEKTLERVKSNLFDNPIISTNKKYLKKVKLSLKKKQIKKYKIVLEPAKMNTAPAILSSALINDIPNDQALVFFASDHLIDKVSLFNKSLKNNQKFLNDENIFVFGIKPKSPSSEYGYFITKRIKKINKVTKFHEKPNLINAKKIINKGGYWNSGMFFLKKSSIIYNFKKFQLKTYKACLESISKGTHKNNVYNLSLNSFKNSKEISFDYAILEKSKKINGIKLNIPWTDLGNWFEISKIFNKNKKKYFNKKNVFYRPWGKYVNLFNGKNFLVKELTVNKKSKLSLQKHFHRSEYWTVTEGKPTITVDGKKFDKKINEKIYIPMQSIHRIENKHNNPAKIIEIQIGSILKETDIIRYEDIYGRK